MAACSSPSEPRAALATGPGAYAIRGLERAPRGIAVLPVAGRVFTISTVGDRGTLDAFDLALRPLASSPVCARPVWIAGDDADARLLIGCRAGRARARLPRIGISTELETNAAELESDANAMFERFSGDHRGTIAVVDARTLTVVTRVRDIDTSTVATFVPAAHGTAYAERAGGALLRIDAVTGSSGSATALPHATPGELHLIGGDAATPLLVADDHDDTAYAVTRDGTAREIAFGQSRLPTAAALAGNAVFVALAGAGTVARVNAARRDVERMIAACNAPVSVFLDAGRNRAFAVCAPREAPHRNVVWFDRNGEDRNGVTIPDDGGLPYPVGVVFSALDEVTGRLVVATAHRVDVIDPNGAPFVVVPDAGHGITALAMDTVHGDVYAAFGDRHGGGVARVGIRAGRPGIPDIAGRIGGDVQTNSVRSDAVSAVVFDESTGPAHRYPPGSRSPSELALRADGSLAVADDSSPVLGTFAHGTYREEPLPVAAQSIALAHDGTLWFAGGTTREHGIIGHRTNGGRIVRYAIESGRPAKIVLAQDGLYWLVRGLHPGVGRIARDGTIARRTIAGATSGGYIIDIAAAPRGGCYVLYGDAVVALTPDGTSRTSAQLPVTPGSPGAIAVFADGTAVVSVPRRLLRIAPGGTIETTMIEPEPQRAAYSTAGPPGCTLTAPAEGPDRSVWGTCGDDVVAVTRSGNVRRFALPFPQSHAQSFVRAPDGSMWFAEPTQSKLGRITPDGQVIEVTI